ncbi:MAG: hypothetical protein AB4206_08595 [Xenococcaceae cyanobacterium]
MTSLNNMAISRGRLTVKLPAEVIERLRNAVYWTPGATVAGLTASAISQYIDQMEAERGEPFPPRKEELKTGRPFKK